MVRKLDLAKAAAVRRRALHPQPVYPGEELPPVCRVGTEMQADFIRAVMLHPVIESLVVTEVEPLLLKLPFEIPISLGDEEKVRLCLLDGGDDGCIWQIRRKRLHPRADR